MSEAENADNYEAGYMVGWLRAKHDGQNNGYFAPKHYPPESPEHDGYQAFVDAVRDRSYAA